MGEGNYLIFVLWYTNDKQKIQNIGSDGESWLISQWISSSNRRYVAESWCPLNSFTASKQNKWERDKFQAFKAKKYLLVNVNSEASLLGTPSQSWVGLSFASRTASRVGELCIQKNHPVRRHSSALLFS